MITTKFEDTYSSVATAKIDTEKLAAVVDFLSKQTEPMTCKEIGVAVFGEDYTDPCMARSYSSRMGQMLRHLREGGFVVVEERDGNEPIEVEVLSRITQDGTNTPLTISVHDDEGNTYEIPNPKVNQRDYWWGFVKKTIIPKIKVYKWVG